MFLSNANVTFDEADLGGMTVAVAVPVPPNRCWLTSLVTAIGPMARQEARRAMSGPLLWAVLALSHLLEAFARLTAVDKAVYPDHRLLTTGLYDGRLPDLLAGRDILMRRYPDKAIVIRSLNERPVGTAWPFRVVWIIQDMQREWAPRTDTRRDRQLLAEAGFEAGRYGAGIDDAKLAHCLALYRDLYLGAYSRFNPDYTEAGLRALLDGGALELHTLEDGDGIVAFCGLHADAETVTLPMMGYDRSRPQSEGLYRAIQVHMAGIAAARGLKLNLSAGAPHFKRHRGAKPWMEYLLIIDDHLPMWRKMGYRGIAWILRRLEPQVMKAAGA